MTSSLRSTLWQRIQIVAAQPFVERHRVSAHLRDVADVSVYGHVVGGHLAAVVADVIDVTDDGMKQLGRRVASSQQALFGGEGIAFDVHLL